MVSAIGLPTLGLMMGVLGAAAMTTRENTLLRKSFVDIAFWLSVAYLSILSLTILLEPLSPLRGADLHGMSNYWMGPFKDFVVAALGYLFTSTRAELVADLLLPLMSLMTDPPLHLVGNHRVNANGAKREVEMDV